MKYLIAFLVALLPLSVSAINITVPSAPGANYVLLSTATGAYTYTSTSSLNIQAAATSLPWGGLTGTLSNQTDLQTALDAKLSLSSWYATTTNGLAEGNTNQYFTPGRAVTALTGQNVSLFTNDAGYLTSLSGAASSTLLGDNNTFSGINSFPNGATIGTSLNPDSNGGPSLGTVFNGFSSVFIKDSASAFTVALQVTNTGTAGSHTLTFDVANYDPILTFQSGAGNPTIGDWFDQSVKTTASPTFLAASTSDISASHSIFVNFAGGLVYSGANKQLLTQATSTLYGTGTPGQVLMWSALGYPVWAATSSSAGGVTSVTGTWPIISSGGNTPNITWGGFASTTAPSSSNLFVSNGGGGIYFVATSSETCTSPLSCAAHTVLGGGGAITILNASGSQGGAIQITDYNRLYTATTTFSSPLVYTAATNAVTCPTCGGGGDPFTHPTTARSATTTTLELNGGAIFSASSTFSYVATTTMLGNLVIGSANTNIFPNTPLVLTSNINSAGQTVIQNLNAGTLASADFIVGADKMNNTSYFADLGCNSSANTDASFTAFLANDCWLYSSDSNLHLSTASSTAANANIIFSTGGTLSANERMRIMMNGRVGVASTSPGSVFSIGAASTPNINIFQIGSTTRSVLLVDSRYHFGFDGALAPAMPTVGTCGTGPTVSGSDANGSVVVGRGTVNACTITFKNPYTNIPRCFLNLNLAAATSNVMYANTTATTFIIRSSASNLGGSKVDYWCMGSSTNSVL